MKKITVLLILAGYLVSVTGIVLSFHWCGGRLNSVKIVYADKHSCGCGTMPMKKGCCKNKISFCKNESEHSPRATPGNWKVNFQKLFMAAVSPLLWIADYSPSYLCFSRYHTPSTANPAPVFLLNRTFLI